jgi:opacity protein-like surface antigen
MRKLLLSGAAFGVLGMPAMAADVAPAYKIPVPVPAFSWSGCYVGGGRTSYSSTDVFFFGCPNCATTSFSNTSSGYVLGGGLEWAPWSNNWIVRGEYLYYNLSGAAGGGFLPGAGFVAANPTWSNMAVSSGRLGLSYKF